MNNDYFLIPNNDYFNVSPIINVNSCKHNTYIYAQNRKIKKFEKLKFQFNTRNEMRVKTFLTTSFLFFIRKTIFASKLLLQTVLRANEKMHSSVMNLQL